MDLLKAIQNNQTNPYVYAYPTTRAYQPITNFDYSKLTISEQINLYLHIPFCKQKCSFCGYLTAVTAETEYEAYVATLIKEIATQRFLKTKTVSTINFGGGTPLLLSPTQLEKIISQLQKSFPDMRQTLCELSIEATPEAVTPEKLETLKELGFNRISIGIQTFNDDELAATKRGNFCEATRRALHLIRQSGIANLCCDLMYGLPGQTLESWQKSLDELLSWRPETIELYNTVTIPGTGLFRINRAASMKALEKRQAYELARKRLLAAGYVQDSHLRFVIPNQGFYRQQVNVFKGETLIGFGVAARSYTEFTHYRNCYDSRRPKASINRYIEKINQGCTPVESAVFLSPHERCRRFIIYNLESLDRQIIKKNFGIDIIEEYSCIWKILQDLGLVHIHNQSLTLTPEAAYYRDLIAAYFFSPTLQALEENYYRP